MYISIYKSLIYIISYISKIYIYISKISNSIFRIIDVEISSRKKNSIFVFVFRSKETT